MFTAGLGEFRIRDLNDEINKLLREKRHWEAQIKELGGPDYQKTGPRMLDHEGKEVPGNRGYKYFGAAKDLPGVRELFEQEPPPPPRKTRAEMMKDIDADYYGYRDDDDGILIPLEMKAEKHGKCLKNLKQCNRKIYYFKFLAIAQAVNEYKAQKAESSKEGENAEQEDEEDIYHVEVSDEETQEDEIKADPTSQPRYIAHVPVPSQQEVEQALLQRRKLELMDKYGVQPEKMETDAK